MKKYLCVFLRAPTDEEYLRRINGFNLKRDKNLYFLMTAKNENDLRTVLKKDNGIEILSEKVKQVFRNNKKIYFIEAESTFQEMYNLIYFLKNKIVKDFIKNNCKGNLNIIIRIFTSKYHVLGVKEELWPFKKRIPKNFKNYKGKKTKLKTNFKIVGTDSKLSFKKLCFSVLKEAIRIPRDIVIMPLIISKNRKKIKKVERLFQKIEENSPIKNINYGFGKKNPEIKEIKLLR